MAWTYDATTAAGLHEEMQRWQDVIAGALFIEATFMNGKNPARERFLIDLYQVLKDFEARWLEVNAGS